MNIASVLPLIVSAISQAGAFESGSPITLELPAETLVLDFPAPVGKVSITEAGATVTIHKT